jgi:nuclear transport factor 2 (NTF2) superfamily protein
VRLVFEIEAETQEEALLQLKHNTLSDYKIVKETRKFSGRRINYHYFEDGEVCQPTP